MTALNLLDLCPNFSVVKIEDNVFKMPKGVQTLSRPSATVFLLLSSCCLSEVADCPLAFGEAYMCVRTRRGVENDGCFACLLPV